LAVFKNLVISFSSKHLTLSNMARFFHPLLLLLARATQAELAQMVDYLKTENRILRSKLPKRVELTASEREQLVKRGKPLGKKIRELITIVSPRTFARWMSGETKSVGKRSTKGGRPRKLEEVRELVVQLAKDNGWGLGRISDRLPHDGLQADAIGIKEMEAPQRYSSAC
jgi:putative transposase